MKPPNRFHTRSGAVAEAPKAPRELPFLASISWFDRLYRELPPEDMLRRYEAGWRHLGVLGEPSAEELRFIRELVARYGSYLDV
jgi:hypothetical protein